MEKQGYMEQGIDAKRLFLVLGKKLWLIFAAAVLGAALGAGMYKIVTTITNGEPEYRASADYYISFYGEGADYYNAYTWDGILRDDPIVDYALTLLPENITKDMVKNAVSGEMLGDYRILTVHVNAETKEKADQIAEAYEKALWNFGQEMTLLDKVELWSKEEATLFDKHNKTGNAAFLGMLLGTLLVSFVLLFYYVLQDGFYIEKDAERRFALPVYGLLTKKADQRQKKLYEDNLAFVFGKKELPLWNAEKLPQSEDYERLRKEEAILLELPWGRDNGRQAERVLRQLEIQRCSVKGIVITEAEDWFVKTYYRIERKEKKELH